jgi:hypothetical protein
MNARHLLIAVPLSFCMPEPTMAQADDPTSARWVVEGCRERIAGKPALYREGMCVGATQTLIALLARTSINPEGAFCVPHSATTGQAARAIVVYLDDNPTLGAHPFIWVAEAALNKAWPCKGTK